MTTGAGASDPKVGSYAMLQEASLTLKLPGARVIRVHTAGSRVFMTLASGSEAWVADLDFADADALGQALVDASATALAHACA